MATATAPSASKGLNPNLSWAFAAAAVVVAAIVFYALNPLKDAKIQFSALIVVSILLSGASTFLTPSKTLGVWGKFALAAIAVAVVFYFRVHGATASAVNQAADTSGLSGLNGGSQAAAATGDFFGKFIGSFGAVAAFICVSLNGLLGAFIGSRMKAKGVSLPGLR